MSNFWNTVTITFLTILLIAQSFMMIIGSKSC